MPLKWSEARSGLGDAKFTIRTAIRRMRSLSVDRRLPVLTTKPDSPAVLDKLSLRFTGM
jgi:hypothetical protein